MNPYEEAIQKGKIKEFFLGRGKYFVLDRDRGTHDIIDTYYRLGEYAKEHGEQALYDQLNMDLVKILKEELLSINDLQEIIGVFWWYSLNLKEEKKLNSTWNISKELKTEIKKQISHHQQNNSDLSNLNSTLSNLKTRFNFEI